MKYIVKTIVNLIINNIPSAQNEMMIRIEGFDDIKIYEEVSRIVSERLEKEKLTVRIVLEKAKYNYFKAKEKDLAYIQSMEQHGWIATNGSITDYRNRHDTDVLILLGTENVEDKGGLNNFFTITPDSLVEDLDGKYHKLLMDQITFSEDEYKIIDKLWSSLFEFVAIDICKLSDQFDSLIGISTIDDFIAAFYSALPNWGLPYKKLSLPTIYQLSGKNNLLRTEYSFISRQLFKKYSKSGFLKIKKKFESYEEKQLEYSSAWKDWPEQHIKSFDELKCVVLDYIRGENIAECRKKLLQTDYSIIESILDLKVERDKVSKTTVPTVYGEPLVAFVNALLQVVAEVGNSIEIAQIEFDIKHAEIVCDYSEVNLDDDNDEPKKQLINAWLNVCRYANGVFEFINREDWIVSDQDVSVCCKVRDIFNPKRATANVDNGIVKAASSNKISNEIEFTIKFKDCNGLYIQENKKDIEREYKWKFGINEDWLHYFSIFSEIENHLDNTNKYIPIGVVDKNIKALLFAKSEEEFFDVYDDCSIDFSSNILKILNAKLPDDLKEFCVGFDKLGEVFVQFLDAISKSGFYSLIGNGNSSLTKLIQVYCDLGTALTKNKIPENSKWILQFFELAFCLIDNINNLMLGNPLNCCIVPAWHPAALEKLNDQKIFLLSSCAQWLKKQDKVSKKAIEEAIDSFMQMSLIQNSVDLFFCSQERRYFSSTNSFGGFSIYKNDKIENDAKLKDLIHKDAIYEDNFDGKINVSMSDDAKMIYETILKYHKAFQKEVVTTYRNFNVVFVNPVNLQPIVAALYQYIDSVKKDQPNIVLNINVRILVRPENRGGKNYLAYWMDECFSQDENVKIRVFLNEWTTRRDINTLLDDNNDIIFLMSLLKENSIYFDEDSIASTEVSPINQCKFPIIFKPLPISQTAAHTTRRIEVSQPQFKASFIHTQVVYCITKNKTDKDVIAVKELGINSDGHELVHLLHEKAYWVVCIDSGLDGALLRSNPDTRLQNDYSVIGFSTGKGEFGKYNLTITAKSIILGKLKKDFKAKLKSLFKWDDNIIAEVTNNCIQEAGGLDGISLFSAINEKDHNIREFLGYVLTSLREKERGNTSPLKIIIHLDSYKHWFNEKIEWETEESKTRPDFLIFEASNGANNKLHLKATVVESKLAKYENSYQHIEKAKGQVKHGLERLKTIFDPNSDSLKRRYWYAQLYRALAFAQISFKDIDKEFADFSDQLRSVLDGNFEIEWSGEVLGYWYDFKGDDEVVEKTEDDNIQIYNIPQKKIIQLLQMGATNTDVSYIPIEEDELDEKEFEDTVIKLDNEDLDEVNKFNRNETYTSDTSSLFEDEATYTEPTVSTEAVLATSEIEEEQTEEIEEEIVTLPPNTEEVKVDTSPKIDLADTRVLIGKDNRNEAVYWDFGNKKMANRHLLITGTSGQGKTYGIQTMLYELSKSNVSSVIFDYTEGFRFDQLAPEFIAKMGKNIKQRVVKFEKVPINPFKRQTLQFGDQYFDESDSDIANRFANIFTHVYKLGDQQKSAIFNAVRKGLSKYGDKMTMENYKSELEEIQKENRAASTVISKIEPFLYSIEFEENSNFDWSEIIYSPEPRLTVFQLTQIDRDMQVIITELMLWDLWYYTKKYGNEGKPFVVVLDEAQNLSHKDKSPSGMILTEGRKFGWSAWYATQSLNVLEDSEVTRLLQSAFKLYFKPTDDEIIKISKQIDPTNSSVWLTPIKKLNKGECIVIGDRVRNDGIFGSTRPCVTKVTSFEQRN